MQSMPLFDWSLQHVFAVLAFLATLIFASVAIRRWFFSPISDLPGPFAAKFSILWQLGITLKGQVGPATVALHKKHGKGYTSRNKVTGKRLIMASYREIRSYWLQ